MGYTEFTKSKIQSIIDSYNLNEYTHNLKFVMDLGSQNDHTSTLRPMPYISDWYKEKGIWYECIDLNKENDAISIDLSKPLGESYWARDNNIGIVEGRVQLLVDAGTSEHVSGENNKFDWNAIFNCWETKHTLLCERGIMYNENPKTGNWPLHGVNYYSQEFYTELVKVADYEILDLGEHPAMNNYVDGWNIFCTLKKIGDKFPSPDEFSKLPIYKS